MKPSPSLQNQANGETGRITRLQSSHTVWQQWGLLMIARIILMIALLSPAMASVRSVQAATITVVNTNDSGSGSFRQALVDANDGDTIDFSVTTPATITLTSGELLVNKSIAISGPG